MERDYQAQMNQLKEKHRNELQETKLIITEEVRFIIYHYYNNYKY